MLRNLAGESFAPLGLACDGVAGSHGLRHGLRSFARVAGWESVISTNVPHQVSRPRRRKLNGTRGRRDFCPSPALGERVASSAVLICGVTSWSTESNKWMHQVIECPHVGTYILHSASICYSAAPWPISAKGRGQNLKPQRKRNRINRYSSLFAASCYAFSSRCCKRTGWM